VRSIVIDHQKPGVLYAGTDNFRVYKSTDGGDNWAVVRRPPWEGGDISGSYVTIDPRVPSHVYLSTNNYVGESVDGGRTWSGGGDPLNNGVPGAGSGFVAVVDTGTPTQTFYGGFSGVWIYQRPAPQPGAPTTVTLSSVPTSTVDDGVIVSGLVVDQHENWVLGGTPVLFDTSLGTVAPTTTLTARGVVTTTLTSSQAGTATVTATVGPAWDAIQVEFVEADFKVFLPLVLRTTGTLSP
jgi:hypothetical protein